MDFFLYTNDQISLYCFQAFHCDAIMGQMVYQFQVNQRDYFSNDTFRGRSLVSRAAYYEVTFPDIFPLRHIFGGVTLAPKCSTYNGRPTFPNPRYLKKAQSEKPCLYEILYDTSDLANGFAPNREETTTLANESRSKLNKDYVKPYDYTRHDSLYEIFKAPSPEYLYQLEHAKEARKTMWRKSFVRTKPNIAKNVAFLPVSKSISKSR
ncbi:hypothetical protein Tco_0200572 [Tanacetum coccineum]